MEEILHMMISSVAGKCQNFLEKSLSYISSSKRYPDDMTPVSSFCSMSSAVEG